ncbi:MAG: amino acid adenylation domain-containing protein [Acidobacteriota bacterium]
MSRDLFEFPATPTQEALWFIYRMDPASSAYNIPVAFRIRGPLDATALERAFTTLVHRHEILRTVFAERAGRLVQLVRSDALPDLRSELVDAGQDPDLKARAHAFAAQPFDLEQGPLVRMRLERFNGDVALLVLVFHHIVIDHLSLGQCIRELSTLYTQFKRETGTALPEPEFQFADYSVWLNEHWSDPEMERKLSVWRKRLEGCSGVLELPADFPRPTFQSSNGAELRFTVDEESAASTRKFARAEGVSLFTVMLGALSALMHRLSGQPDVIIGVPFANRGDEEDLERVVGCFINTLPIASRFSGSETFRDLTHSIKMVMLESLENQDVPLEAIVDLVQLRRDPSRNPLFQVGFVLQAPPVVLELEGLELKDMRTHSGGAMYDLHFWLWENGTGIDGLVWYSTDLFAASTVQRLVERYLLLAGEAASCPDGRIDDLPILLESERALLAGWNATSVPFEGGLRLGDLVRRQALQSAERTAVVFEKKALSYRDLDARARRLALQLRSMGVGPGSLVGVCLERSLELVTALVGIAYSGGAWVPLDPTYPSKRLADMCEDAHMSVVVSRPSEIQSAGLTLPDGVQLLFIDDSDVRPDPDSDGEFELIGTSDDPAYVIFTSGSTGRPKGAINAHRGIINRLLWGQAEFALSEDDRVMQKTPYSFDISVWEFFWPLITGATLVVSKPGGHGDARYLAELIREAGVTVMHFVPSMLRIFLEENGIEDCSSLRLVIASGESLPADVVDRFFARLPHARLANLYGPTETAIEVSYWECRSHDGRLTVPIGKPVANTQLYVLDGQLRQVPIGMPGELYIGGVQVGAGYVSRPALTSERFITDALTGGTMYRTGDRARWLNDGVVEYLGRTDHQVKIRGHRIELGEIESVLVRHPALAEAVVMAREYSALDRRLVAYVRFSNHHPLTNTELRRQLREYLPEHMIPQLFVEVEAIPLLANGKIDRAALPDPLEHSRLERTIVAPRTRNEKRLAEIWREALRGVAISADSNFFEVGGHSLLAMQVIFHVERAFGVRFNPRDLILNSLEQLAARLPAGYPEGDVETASGRTGILGRVKDKLGF